MSKDNKKELREILIVGLLSFQVFISIALLLRMRSLEQAFISFGEIAANNSNPVLPIYVEGVSPGNGFSIGPETAPITIVEFSDFQCPYCSSAVPLWKSVLGNYPDQLRLVYRHFALPSHPNAIKAALAAECAGEQGYFWEMHDLLFASQDRIGELPLELLAEEINLDMGTFNDCMSSQRYIEKIQQDKADGETYGVQGTPTFFINGYRLTGFNQETFVRLIEETLLRTE